MSRRDRKAVSNMRLAGILLAAIILFWTTPAYAADLKFGVTFARQADGAAVGEFWYDDKMVWRLKICSDGVRPVSGSGGDRTTVITPDVVRGLFLLKVESR